MRYFQAMFAYHSLLCLLISYQIICYTIRVQLETIVSVIKLSFRNKWNVPSEEFALTVNFYVPLYCNKTGFQNSYSDFVNRKLLFVYKFLKGIVLSFVC